MCRLLSYVCAAEATPTKVLADLVPRFSAMSREHKHGWGMAWLDPDGVQVVREPVAALNSDRFEEVTTTVSSNVAMLHLRLATGDLAVSAANTHPFLYDGLAFMHNGSIEPIPDIESLIAHDLRPGGETDSERYFLAVLSSIRSGESREQALLGTAKRLLDLPMASGANAMLLTPYALHVVCAYHPGTQPPGRPDDYFGLRYRADEYSIVVASTGVPQDGWEELPNGSVLTIARNVLEYTVTMA